MSAQASPPEGLPLYRLITGSDDAAFCEKVSEQLRLGYRLHGNPALTFGPDGVVTAQAVIWPDPE